MSTPGPTHVRPSTLGFRTLVGSLAVAALVAIPVTAGALQPAAKSGSTVKVKLFEFQVKPKPKIGTSGRVRFNVKNIGTEVHEFVVVKSDGTPLPTLPDGSVDEEAIPETSQFGEVEDVEPKKSGSLVVKSLPAGDYELFCNVVEDESGTTVAHYAEGMTTDFTVG